MPDNFQVNPDDVARIARALGQGNEKKTEAGWMTCCPAHGDNNPSLSLGNGNSGKLVAYCHAGCSFQAIIQALEDRGLLPRAGGSEIEKKKNLPRFIWDNSQPGHLAIQKYLENQRNISLEKIPYCLRFNEYQNKRSIVMPVTTHGGPIEAINRIYLDERGRKTGAKMLGPCKGRGVWFQPTSEKMIAGEGPETVLSCMAATGLPGVAALSASGLKAIKIPRQVKKIIIVVDSDPNRAGQEAALTLAERFHGEVWLAMPDDSCFTDKARKLDFNDLTPGQIRARFDNLIGPDAVRGSSPITVKEKAPNKTEIKPVDWPVLSPEALPGIVGELVGLAAENSEVDPAAVLATFLVRFGVEVGPGPFMWVGDTRHRCTLAAVIVGASSKARKGTSGKPVKRLFKAPVDLPEHQSAQTTKGPFSSGEGIVYAIRDEVKKFNEKDQEWIVVDPGIEDKRLFILDEEFAGVLAQTRREGNTLSMVIRQLWDSGNLEPLIKHNRTKVTGGHVGWVSHITLFELDTRLDQAEAFNGFANRILWVCSKRPKLVAWPQPMDGKRLGEIQAELFRVISAAQAESEIRPGEEARRIWSEKYYPELTRSRPGLLGSVTSRAEAQVLRLAMIYCLLDNKTKIEPSHLESAVAFWNYCEQSARFIFHGRTQDTVANKIQTALESGPMTGTEMHRLFKNNLSKARLEAALAELIASKQIEKNERKTGQRGRPVNEYKIKEKPSELNEQNELKPGKGAVAPFVSLNSFNSSGKCSDKNAKVKPSEIVEVTI